ncbi:Acyl-CoA Binding Protein [Zostera marina]|uniref:Acyl-CoA Binding Protein n=1 Tax=Zostera marina TaxID=29655 RepID=A0A0K9PFA5_ZOSMR|nr:Acyl-CoA Binding Protein [Zostera marina]
MAKPSSGVPYPERFYVAAEYAGLGDRAKLGNFSRFENDVALMLYGLHRQATVGPCNAAKPGLWNVVEHGKWTSWSELGAMASTEAMRLFVKLLEEEEPNWYSKASEFLLDPIHELEINKTKLDTDTQSENYPETKTIAENGCILETRDKDIILEGVGSVGTYNQWVALSISGEYPKPRYQHGAAVLQDKMYVFGGNFNGRHLNDFQVLDLKSLTWSKVENTTVDSQDASTITTLSSCAGHSMVSWENKIISIAGYTKDPSEIIHVNEFNKQTCAWSSMKTYGKAPISRGGQSATLVGTTLVIFGGEGAKKTLLNDLHILDLESMTWDEIDTIGVPPSPRSDHSSAIYNERYLFIFGGGSHSTCFNDLHILDMNNMKWSKPTQKGTIPSPRAGHAGITIGVNWFIVGGGDNKSGASETYVLNMSTLVWSIVTTVQERIPVASEGLSLVLSSCTGEDILVSYGGYNGRYSKEVYVLKPRCKSDVLSSKTIENNAPEDTQVLLPTSTLLNDVEIEIESSLQSGRAKEIIMDNIDSEHLDIRSDETNIKLLEDLRSEKGVLEAELAKEKSKSLHLKQKLDDAEAQKIILTQELQSVLQT